MYGCILRFFDVAITILKIPEMLQLFVTILLLRLWITVLYLIFCSFLCSKPQIFHWSHISLHNNIRKCCCITYTAHVCMCPCFCWRPSLILLCNYFPYLLFLGHLGPFCSKTFLYFLADAKNPLYKISFVECETSKPAAFTDQWKLNLIGSMECVMLMFACLSGSICIYKIPQKLWLAEWEVIMAK